MRLALPCFLLLALLGGCIETHPKKSDRISEQKTESYQLPKPIRIADLPDSLKPEYIPISEESQLLRVEYPAGIGSNYTVPNEDGSTSTFELKPPVNKAQPYLKDRYGNPVMDTLGKPIRLGFGGDASFVNYGIEEFPLLETVNSLHVDKHNFLWAGTFGAGVSRFDGVNLETFTTETGLAGNVVRAILEDKQGSIWFATDQGVSVYDGKSMISYTSKDGLGHDDIWNMCEDSNGDIWFATLFGGLSRYNGDTIVSYTHYDEGVFNMPSDVVEDRSGNIWIATRRNGLLRFDAARRNNPCYNLECSHESSDSTEWHQHQVEIGRDIKNVQLPESLAGATVSELYLDLEGKLWVSFWSKGCAVVDLSGKNAQCLLETCAHNHDDHEHKAGIKSSFKIYNTRSGLAGNFVTEFISDSEGRIYMSSFGGLSVLTDDGIISYTEEQGLPNNNIKSLALDENEELWIGTQGGGLSRLSNLAFTNIREAHGLVNYDVRTIAELPENIILLGTNCQGLVVLENDSIYTYDADQGIYNSCIYSILPASNGDIWYGMWNYGLLRYDGKEYTHYTDKQLQNTNTVTSLAEDEQGNIWIGTSDGLRMFDGDGFFNYQGVPSFPNDWVREVLVGQDGYVWTCSDEGLFEFDGSTAVRFKQEHGLGNSRVRSIYEDSSGSLWIGLEDGHLRRYDGNGFLRIEPIHSGKGEFIEDITSDKDGQLWIANSHGLLSLQFRSLVSDELVDLSDLGPNTSLREMQPVWTEFSERKGFPVSGIQSLFIDNKGLIWAASHRPQTSLAVYNKELKPKISVTPEVRIINVKLNEEDVMWNALQELEGPNILDSSVVSPITIEEARKYSGRIADSALQEMKKEFHEVKYEEIESFSGVPVGLKLPYEHNDISIEFGSTNLANPNLIEYQYQMKGYTSNWSPVSISTSARLGNIREGSYQFQVRCRFEGGEWSDTFSYGIEVMPPWYRTWWAYLIYLLGILGFLRIFSLWRERSLRLKNEQLETLVKSRTREVVSQKEEAETQRKRSDELLLNILPYEVAEELKKTGKSEARDFDEVTVLFTDFQGFTKTAEQLSAKELVNEINTCFRAFDEIIEKYGVEKIKTIGDAYMAAGGLHSPRQAEVNDVVHAALEMQEFMTSRAKARDVEGLPSFQMRVGIHTGAVVAGIVGVKKFQYDIWGDTVNTASRMESNGAVQKVNVSQTTYENLMEWIDKNSTSEEFKFESRGMIEVKGKGKVQMYFVSRKKPEV